MCCDGRLVLKGLSTAAKERLYLRSLFLSSSRGAGSVWNATDALNSICDFRVRNAHSAPKNVWNADSLCMEFQYNFRVLFHALISTLLSGKGLPEVEVQMWS